MSQPSSNDLSVSILEFLLTELSRICARPVDPDTSLLKTGTLDSMGLVETIVSVQSKFNLQVNLSAIKRETFDTPKMMASFMADHRAA